MGMTYGSGGGLTPSQQATLNNLKSPLLSNLSGITSPTSGDDSSKGYSVGSTWIFGGATYTCTDSTPSAAVWSLPTDIYYFQDWPSLVTAINAADTTYINKFASVANANGGPSAIGIVYTSPATINSPIADGNAAVYKVIAEGVGTYSVKLQQRPLSSFRITSVMTVSAAKPTVDGYYIFQVNPTGGMPQGVALNDIAQLKSGVWSLYQSFANSDVSIPVGATATTVSQYQKVGNTWQPPAILACNSGSVYEFSQAYANNGSWNTIACVLGGMRFRWNYPASNALQTALVIERDPTRTTQPSTMIATFFQSNNNGTVVQDNQSLYQVTPITITGTGITGNYQMVTCNINARDVNTKIRFRITCTTDGSTGLSMLAEYWGPVYI